MMYGWGWGGWIVMTLLMVLFWAAVITAIVLGVRYFSEGVSRRNQGGVWMTRTPEDVLAERFARGDIDEEEYRRRMALFHEHRSP